MDILVIANGVRQAQEYWKDIKDKCPVQYSRVKFVSNRIGMLDGIRPKMIILCGSYWNNKVYKSNLYDWWIKLGAQIVYGRDL
ncbi:hypothetical protein [Bacillus wiedmannii]|uniref:hypothetical protein n=1 Tax=Bacillus wiedmannii TaxID=1890302 RepID=UPI002E2005A1|nr:hypothetical protein [Bacillus wiedmannii]